MILSSLPGQQSMKSTVFDLIVAEDASVSRNGTRSKPMQPRPYYSDRLAGSWTLYVYNKPVRGQSKRSPYTKVYQLQDVADFANVAKILTHQVDGASNFREAHFALMRGAIAPIWEDRANKDGGALEVIFNERNSASNLVALLARLVSNQMMEPEDPDNDRYHSYQINGITFERADQLNFENGLKVSIWNDLATTKQEFMHDLSEPARAIVQSGKVNYSRHREQGNFGSYSKR